MSTYCYPPINSFVPLVQDINIVAGDTYTLPITFTINNVAVDITGATITAIAKQEPTAPDAGPGLMFNVDQSGNIVSGPTGQFNFIIPSAATLNNPITRSTYQLIVEVGGARYTILAGIVNLFPSLLKA